MNINKFKYFFLDALKSLKRNITLTVFSVFTVSATIFIVGLFLIYLLSVNKNSATIFINNKGMSAVFQLNMEKHPSLLKQKSSLAHSQEKIIAPMNIQI
ncbi:hypothetical protein [Clostridium saccharoperbutylacetonicum]|uniref:hypothetical protein n=1 Tax=Clostridium saccharoperbutylacetonicum TaxID=36745 RepID=UPI000983DEA1|nr:hypothetical protein [Clostridium saccharoperbutylacetonicum]AQR95940.1 hypothetical protein CLSAP_32580 [Clostridium saccharoperbutylacetonicum]NSB31807.1 cell division protein FtsX [Clostridium saccharoperbutylacetonicum]